MNKHLLVVTLNIHGLNDQIKRQRIAEWIRNHDPRVTEHTQGWEDE